MKLKKGYILSLLITGTVCANCGSGKITQVLEGGWNTNDFMIKIDYSGSAASNALAGTEKEGFIVYKSNLDDKRLNGIKAIALTAFSTSQTVNAKTHNGKCDEATELSLIK